jgi:tyrosine-protein kinase Etk/Wzc
MRAYDEDIEDVESGRLSFDFRGFLFKALNLWKVIVLSIGLALTVAYFINVRKPNIYRLETIMSVENEQSPFFSSNTSIQFNWGGVSGKVSTVMTAVETRTHNELVVDSLQFFKTYLAEGEYRLEDIYTQAPFEFRIDRNQPQLLNRLMEVQYRSPNAVELRIPELPDAVSVQTYSEDHPIEQVQVTSKGPWEIMLGEPVQLPFLNGQFVHREGRVIDTSRTYYLRFSNFDQVVNSYQGEVKVSPFNQQATNVLRLEMTGLNKAKIVDYLNATTAILSETELRQKNQFATNTIRFIDSSLNSVNADLSDVIQQMNEFRRNNQVFNVDDEINFKVERMKNLDLQYEEEKLKLEYLNSLEDYLNNKTDYTKIAAPSSVGIMEPNITSSVSKITELAIQRQNLEYTTQPENILFKDVDRQIDAEKNVLLETLKATRNTINIQLSSIQNKIAQMEAELRDLPEEEQEYLKIQRQINISQQAYDVFLARRSEAAISKAANVSDIKVIDAAKDIGGGKIGPNTSLNYMMALMIGFFVPMFLIFIIFLLDNTIHGSDQVTQLSSIPIIGLIGKYPYKNNLVVLEKPKSAVAESFRAIRSSLQFIYQNQQARVGGRTLMVTSSVSGEGKTFTSINISTAYALSGKKTVLLGLDLRKPKIFGDFNINNERGIVNHLIGEQTLEEVKFETHVENLTIIPSGPIPPNPSELLASVNLTTVINQLRKDYDIVILDTPPIGLVADALELSHYADATLFMIRLDYTRKGMLQLINAKYRNGQIKNVHFVLNFYRHKANSNYGYGYGTYGRAYLENDARSRFKRIWRWIRHNL